MADQDFLMWNNDHMIDGPKMIVRVYGSHNNMSIIRVNPCVITYACIMLGVSKSDVFIY